VVGGVAANRRLRDQMARAAAEDGFAVSFPPPALCTDNAAMIASAARWVEPLAYPRYLDVDAYASIS
jgi:N6-L-threonylcarbamoyladenine synthase